MSKTLFHETSRERWHFYNIDEDAVDKWSNRLSLDPLIVKLLSAKQVITENEQHVLDFINPSEDLITRFKWATSDEDLLKATTRIKKALDNKERIVINGDPDADGITGTVILTAGLRLLGGEIHYDFPTRSKEGHGLQPRIIDEAKQSGASLIITSDCGSKDVESVKYAISQNVDVIICDHHILGKEIPAALAIVNPYRRSEKTFEQSLAGAGVSFKLVLAVFNIMGRDVPDHFMEYMLAISALGTISDRMSFLNPMNRLMVKRGIKALNQTRMEGLKALKDVSSNGIEELRSNDIGRTIVPRLNAPGRIGDRSEGIPDSRIVVDLLLLGSGRHNAQKASEVLEEFNYVLELDKSKKSQSNYVETSAATDDASVVEDINEKRKFMTSKIEDEIDALVKEQVDIANDKIIIVQGKNWNPGVIGIDTDRLKDRFLRPAVILTEYTGSDFIRGSVRSIPTINMYHIVDTVAEQFEKKHGHPLFQTEVLTLQGKRLVNAFGGHAQACGFTFHKNDLNDFVALIREGVDKLSGEQFNFSYEILDTLQISQINYELVQKLEQLSPYGQEFDYPLFFMEGIGIGKARPFGNKYQEARTPHVEFWVFGNHKKGHQAYKINAVGFGLWEKLTKLRSNQPNTKYDIIFSVEFFKKRVRKRSIHKLRLNVVDIRVSSEKE
jgi:single-stranded-DNA-specific exonuclease